MLFPGRPIKSTVIKKWIAAGLLKARKSGRARLVAAEEVERFRLEYCLAEEACRILGITRSTLSHWEAEGTCAAGLRQAGHSWGRLFTLPARGSDRVVTPPRAHRAFLIALARSFAALCGGRPGVLSFLEPRSATAILLGRRAIHLSRRTIAHDRPRQTASSPPRHAQMAPAVSRHVAIDPQLRQNAFGHMDAESREDAVEEVIANAAVAFVAPGSTR